MAGAPGEVSCRAGTVSRFNRRRIAVGKAEPLEADALALEIGNSADAFGGGELLWCISSQAGRLANTIGR
jgi:hypothetical protein